MNNRILMVGLMTFMLTATSCQEQPKTSTSATPSAVTSAAPASPIAAPASGAPASPIAAGSTAPGGAFTVVNVVTGNAFDEKTKSITNVVEELTTADKDIYFMTEVTGARKGTKFHVVLHGIDLKAANGQVAKDIDLTSVDFEATEEVPAGAPYEVHSHFSPPPAGWPTGKYSVNISADGQPLKPFEFEIKPAAGAAGGDKAQAGEKTEGGEKPEAGDKTEGGDKAEGGDKEEGK